jgi:integrase
MEIASQVADFLGEKDSLARRGNLSFATVEQYRFVLERVFLPWWGSQGEAVQCTDKAMDRFTDSLMTRNKALSVSTVRTYIRAVRVFLTWADVDKGKYEAPRKPRRLLDVLTRQEIDRLEAAASNERDRLIVRVLADTGLRIGELIGLKPADLRANRHDRQFLIRVIGKGDKQRDVPIPPRTFERLEAHAKRAGVNIFEPRYAVGPLTRHGIDKLFRHLGMRAKIDKRTNPHGLRHAYISHAIIKGVSPIIIQKTVGHETLTMISTVYSHILGSDSHDTLIAAFK